MQLASAHDEAGGLSLSAANALASVVCCQAVRLCAVHRCPKRRPVQDINDFLYLFGMKMEHP